jgi:hypothetical protein
MPPTPPVEHLEMWAVLEIRGTAGRRLLTNDSGQLSEWTLLHHVEDEAHGRSVAGYAPAGTRRVVKWTTEVVGDWGEPPSEETDDSNDSTEQVDEPTVVATTEYVHAPPPVTDLHADIQSARNALTAHPDIEIQVFDRQVEDRPVDLNEGEIR